MLNWQLIGIIFFVSHLGIAKAQVGSFFLGYSTNRIEVDDHRVNMVPGSVSRSVPLGSLSLGWLYNQTLRFRSTNIETGLILTQTGGQWSYQLPNELEIKQSLVVNQIQIPLNFRVNLYHMDGVGINGGIPVYFLGGVKGGISLSGEETLSTGGITQKEKMTFSEDKEDYYMYDLGAYAGIALKLSPHTSLEAIAYRGLRDFINLYEKSAFNRSLEFRLRYQLGVMEGERRYFFHQFFRNDYFW